MAENNETGGPSGVPQDEAETIALDLSKDLAGSLVILITGSCLNLEKTLRSLSRDIITKRGNLKVVSHLTAQKKYYNDLYQDALAIKKEAEGIFLELSEPKPPKIIT